MTMRRDVKCDSVCGKRMMRFQERGAMLEGQLVSL
jgi:hypothetical protein